MAGESQEARNGIWHDWDSGSSGYKDQMDANLLKIGTLLGLSAIDRDLTAPPGSPNDGDTYIVGASPTGAWAGEENSIAVWRDDDSAWEFYDPADFSGKPLCYIEDETKLVVWDGTDWDLGVTLT